MTLIDGVVEQEFIPSKFPFKYLWVELDRLKVTGAPGRAFRNYWGANIVQKIYHEKHLVNKYDYNLVWWDRVKKVMYEFPQMFRVFITKQTSKFCGMNRQLSRFGNSVENVCPSHGKDDESMKHITRYRDPGR